MRLFGIIGKVGVKSQQLYIASFLVFGSEAKVQPMLQISREIFVRDDEPFENDLNSVQVGLQAVYSEMADDLGEVFCREIR
jgi:hypothetical protein